ncbi:hypothetical protein AAFN88_16150 [Pelagibius sp. CAU 1746]|uniref:hypothetical protein n=1 Tax=Pelagibius sp. CAU 1746 TaxID=3140370 RepID=UPI00325B1AE9
MMKTKALQCLTALLTLSVTALPSAAAAEQTPATYCVTISVTIEETEALVSRLDGFALNAGLTFETTDPGGRYYVTSDDSAMIALRNGMAEFGSILSYVPMNKEASGDLPVKLEQFVAQRISPSYDTMLCQEIDGFSMPTIFR